MGKEQRQSMESYFPKVTKPVVRPGFKPRKENCHTFNYYIILSHNNVNKLMGGQRTGKLFQKEYSDKIDEFAVLISVSFNYRQR